MVDMVRERRGEKAMGRRGEKAMGRMGEWANGRMGDCFASLAMTGDEVTGDEKGRRGEGVMGRVGDGEKMRKREGAIAYTNTLKG